MKKKNIIWLYPLIVMGFVLILSNSCKKKEDDDNNPPPITITDIDGNIYNKITIGAQVWMVENLKVTKYNDGTAIQLVTNGTAWENPTPGYCWYDNDESTYKNPYGALYNWYTVNTGKLCPTGWHMPTDAEWDILINYLGGDSIAGCKMKETGTTHWNSPNTGANNESGFTGLPGGYRNSSGNFSYMDYNAYFWSSTMRNSNSAWGRKLNYASEDVIHHYDTKGCGFSIRCLKD